MLLWTMFAVSFKTISNMLYSMKQQFASQPLESPGFLEKSKVDLSIVKEEAYKEVLWYKNSHHN